MAQQVFTNDKNQRIYSCKITKYVVHFELHENNIAYFISITTDYKYPNAVCILINYAIDKLKKEGIIFIFQDVNQSEWEEFLENKTSWDVVHEEKDILTIRCDIDDFLENFGVGIGLNDSLGIY